MENKITTFIKTFVIWDLVICSMKFFYSIFFIIVSLITLGSAYSFGGYSIYFPLIDYLLTLILTIVGISGNILLLLNKKNGVYYGFANIALTIITIIFAIWQNVMMYDFVSQYKNAAFFGIGILIFSLLLRIPFLVFYTISIIKAKNILFIKDVLN